MLEGWEGSILRVAPTTHSGQVLGIIVAIRPPGGDQFTTDDDTMLTELGGQVGLALHNVELDPALQESLEEVRRQADELQASRVRVVAASNAARRQIERNLDDWAQQHLVASAVNVRLAPKLAESDPSACLELLDQLGVDLQDAVQELRSLAHRIYPPLLIDRGLGDALRAASSRAAHFTEVVAPPLPVLARDRGGRLRLLHGGAAKRGQARPRGRVRHRQGLCGRLAPVLRGFGHRSGLRPVGYGGQGAGFVIMSDRVGTVGGTLKVDSAVGRDDDRGPGADRARGGAGSQLRDRLKKPTHAMQE